MIGKQIEKYTIISLLGQGGMAEVYLAEDFSSGSKVAIKILNSEFLNPSMSNIKNRFIAEAKILATIDHPNVVKVFNLIIQPHLVAYAMEYLPGITLQQLINEKRKFHDIELREIILKLLKAIGNIHNNNIIHRDIKPSNIIISNKGDLKLVDFGIAKGIGYNLNDYTNTAVGQNMGTPRYMSPEQIKGMKDTTIHTDIYSVGVVLWQMVSGNLPYNYPFYEIQSRVVNDYLPDTFTIWDGIIKKATDKEITNRFKSADDFCMAINQFQDRPVIEDYNDETVIESVFVDKDLKEKSESNRDNQRGNNLRIKIKLTLEEIVNGVEKKIKINRKVKYSDNIIAPSSINQDSDGMVVIEEQLTIKIPPGAINGQQYKVLNKGNEGLNNGLAGDLILLVEELEDLVYKREGYDIIMNLPISYSEARNGATKIVKTLNGKTRIKIEKETPDGKILRLKDKGVFKNDGLEKGDLLIYIDVKRNNSNIEYVIYAIIVIVIIAIMIAS